ncbi:hypothetical protein RRG08_006044 [Elysia crispata]|uniref:Uncharacterized protein n=1 Tax=Elysia crispata TaxID=231223 RepID=A0AAE1D9B9_9GAST|nr:hypothetical protein RRG08_006044 [Elysia crispata]
MLKQRSPERYSLLQQGHPRDSQVSSTLTRLTRVRLVATDVDTRTATFRWWREDNVSFTSLAHSSELSLNPKASCYEVSLFKA